MKSECRAQHAIENPFPKLAKDLTGSINKILMASLVEWLEGGQQVEEGRSFLLLRHVTYVSTRCLA